MEITPIKTASEIAAELQGRDQPETDTKRDPKDNREYSFVFDYQDFKGRRYRDRFTNQILSPNQEIQVGVLKAQLLGRVPYDSIDVYVRELSHRISHLTVSLIKRPKWAAELGDLLDTKIIHKLYEEVMAHEATFRRSEPDKEESAGSTEDDLGEPTGVVVQPE